MTYRVFTAGSSGELEKLLTELDGDRLHVESTTWDGNQFVIIVHGVAAGGPYDGTEQR